MTQVCEIDINFLSSKMDKRKIKQKIETYHSTKREKKRRGKVGSHGTHHILNLSHMTFLSKQVEKGIIKTKIYINAKIMRHGV